MSCSEATDPATTRIGPGRLVLVVGPSGAGKDTIIRHAREKIAGDPRFVFPRRMITRPPDATEDNITVDDAGFAAASANCAFALEWSAHGHRYGLPVAVDDDIRQGRVVVANVSRRIVERAHARFAHVEVVLVTASDAILAQRLTSRGRDPDIDARLRRASDKDGALFYALVIRNEGAQDAASTQFLDFLKA